MTSTNSQLVYLSRSGLRTLDFNITSFSRGIDLMLPDGTARNRVDYYPIRFSEQSIRFTVESKVQDESKASSQINKLRKAIRTHMIGSLNSKLPKPMKFTYVPTRETFTGIIEQIPYELNTSSYSKRSYSFTLRTFGEYTTAVEYSNAITNRSTRYVPTIWNITPNTEWWL